MNLMTMNDMEKIFATILLPKISAVHNWTFCCYQMKTIFECKNISCDYECLQGLNGGKKFWHDGDDKANGIRFAFYLFISLRETRGKFFDISHLVKSSLQAAFDAFQLNPIMRRKS